jgi:hypothetical protein
MVHPKDPAGFIILIGVCLGFALMVGLFRSRSPLAGFFGGAFGWGLIALVTLNFGDTRWGGGAPNGLIGGIIFFMIGAVVGLIVGLVGNRTLLSKDQKQSQGDTNQGDSQSPAKEVELKLYSVKKRYALFWKCGLTRESINEQLGDGQIRKDWLVCEYGNVETAVPVSRISELYPNEPVA